MRYLLALPLAIVTVSLCHCVTIISAATYQQCETSSTCTIGEFLYSDNYSALPSQSCTLTVKDPAGTAVLTNQAMTSRADGWYSYDVTTGTTTGLYTATMCCVPTDGTLCLDKSYEVKEPPTPPSTLTAAEVWGYSSRSLTSFGSLVSDIWGHSTRSLTTFGDLVSNIWSSSAATTNTQITNVQADLDTQRLLLEKLVQEPVISLDLSVSSNTVTQTLEQHSTRLATLGSQIDEFKSELLIKLASFDQLNKTDRLALIDRWHTQALAISNEATYFADNYNHDLTLTLSTQAQTLLSQARELKANFSNSSSNELLTLIDSLSTLSSTINGNPLNPNSDTLTNLFHNYLSRAAELDSNLTHLDNYLANWGKENISTQNALSARLTTQIMALNQYVGAAQMLSTSTPKNTLLSLRAILTMNQKLLLPKGSGSVAGMWLEDGSVIWKASLYNPSRLVTLPATLSFHLPREVKPEHILSHDDNLTVNFDPDTDSLKVSGNFTLSPLSTQLALLQVQDVWTISTDQLNELKKHLGDNLTALGKSQFYSQGLTTKQELESIIAKIEASQDSSLPPAERIRRYRENQLALLTAQTKLGELDTIVAQVKSTTSLKGWIGGSQLASTWGIIMIIIGGFTFFGYRLLRPASVVAPASPAPPPLTPLVSPVTVSLPIEPNSIPWVPVGAAFGLSLVVLGGLYTLNPRLRSTPPAVNQVITTPIPTPLPSPTPTVSRDTVSLQIIPPEDGSVNVRNGASTSSDIVMSIKQPTDVIIFATENDWSQIGFTDTDKIRGYWVKSEFLSQP